MSAMTSWRQLLRDRISAVWAVLVLATVVSFTVGSEDGRGMHAWASAVIIVIAMLKVRLVGLYFMELRDAPTILRGLFETYCLLACVELLGLFLVH